MLETPGRLGGSFSTLIELEVLAPKEGYTNEFIFRDQQHQDLESEARYNHVIDLKVSPLHENQEMA